MPIPYNILAHTPREAPEPPPDLSAADVIARMTNPSTAVQDGITEFVTSEKAALNDNWARTDNVLMMMSDQEVNAKTFWKPGNIISTTGTPAFQLYDGINFPVSGPSYYETDIDSVANNFNHQPSDGYMSSSSLSIHNRLTDTSIKSYFSIVPQGSYRTLVYVRYNGTYTRLYALYGGKQLSQTITPPVTQEDSQFIITMLPSSTESYIDNELAMSTSASLFATNGTIRIGCGESTSWYYRGTLSHFSYGGGVDFDRIAHDAHVQKYRDRMTIAGNQVEVDSVLAQYTGLITREILATSRLIARSERNGNWSHVISAFLAFYIPANAIIDLQDTPGDGILPDAAAWAKDKNIADNEIMLGEADTYNWDIAQLYDYSDIDMQAEQIEEFVDIINNNSTTMPGRTLDISGNDGVDLNAEVSIAALVVKGFTVIQ